MLPELNTHLLSVVTFAPLATALLLLAINCAARLAGATLPVLVWRTFGLAASGLSFVLSLSLFTGFDLKEPSFQFVEHAAWLPSWGIDYFIGIDGISLFLVLLTTFLTPIVLVTSRHEVAQSRSSWVFFVLCLETGLLGAFVSLNLFQLYFFWEALLVPIVFVIGVWGGPGRRRAAQKFLVFSALGSLPLLFAILVLASLPIAENGALLFNLVAPPGAGGAGLLDLPIAVDGPIWWQNQAWLFAAFALAFAIKLPLVPLHNWLPDALVEAPTGGSVLVAGVLLKLGGYGFLRFAVPLFPDATLAVAPLFLCLAVVGIVYGSLLAMVQTDLKRLVAYASLAHLGLAALGIFALNTSALNGAVLQLVNHGLVAGALFLLVEMLHRRRSTRLVSEFGGVAKPMPVLAACFGVVILSSVGLPGLSGFVGELLILVGAYLASPLSAVAATSGVLLLAAGAFWMFRRVMFGPIDNPENRGLIDLGLGERLVMLAFLLPIVGIGVYPEPLLRRIEPSVVELLRRVDSRTQTRAPSEPAPEHERTLVIPIDPSDEGEAL